MGFLKSTTEMKQEVLEICGEVTDGTSPFDATVLNRLNSLHQSLLAGGNEFGIDIAEPWVWAQTKRPVLLSLLPGTEVSAILTQGINSGTFTAAPAASLQGTYLRVDTQPDLYRVALHTAGSTAFYLDQTYLQSSGTYNAIAFQLDYQVVSNDIVIDATNNQFDFSDNGAADLTATVASGVYTPVTLAAALQAAMRLVGTKNYTVNFNTQLRVFTVATDGTRLDLFAATGSGVTSQTSMFELLGFEMQDLSGALTYTSVYALSGILRFTKPLAIYREAPLYYSSPKDVGKIFMIDDNTFLRNYPLNRLTQQIPDRFCVSEMSQTGLVTIRINSTPLNETIRAEAYSIPVTRKLVDSVYSYAKVPGSYTDFLIYGAASFVLLLKSDNKAAQYEQLAVAKLKAMMNDNRKGLGLGGINFGKLIPRRSQNRIWGYYR